jgi:uncharacterized membrane protein
MVKQDWDGQTRVLVLLPNRSMSWRQNRWLIALLGGFTLIIALVWTVVGAWVILPFAGIEVMALAAGLYYVSWKLHLRQVVRITASSVTVEEGRKTPIKRWQLDSAALAIEAPAHPWDAPAITLYDRVQQVSLGSFLNREDSELLIELLQEAGVRVRSSSVPRQQEF